MAAEAAWYPDPTQEGRLRFWDGTGWTQHVSDQAPTSDPIDGTLPPPQAPSVAPPSQLRDDPSRVATESVVLVCTGDGTAVRRGRHALR